MNKIVLITTKGCEGCSIMRNSIKQALNNTSKKIEFVIKDITELDKKEKSLFSIHYKVNIFFKNITQMH